MKLYFLNKNKLNFICFFMAFTPILGYTANTINDDNNYLGDKISFPINIKVTSTDNKDVCILAGKTMYGLGKVENGILKVGLAKNTKDCNEDDLPDNYEFTIKKEVLKYALRSGLTYGGLIVSSSPKIC